MKKFFFSHFYKFYFRFIQNSTWIQIQSGISFSSLGAVRLPLLFMFDTEYRRSRTHTHKIPRFHPNYGWRFVDKLKSLLWILFLVSLSLDHPVTRRGLDLNLRHLTTFHSPSPSLSLFFCFFFIFFWKNFSPNHKLSNRLKHNIFILQFLICVEWAKREKVYFQFVTVSVRQTVRDQCSTFSKKNSVGRRVFDIRSFANWKALPFCMSTSLSIVRYTSC